MGYSISGFITDTTNGEPIAFSNTTISDIKTNRVHHHHVIIPEYAVDCYYEYALCQCMF